MSVNVAVMLDKDLRREKALLMWAKMLGMDKVSDDIRSVYQHYNYKELVRPFVVQDRKIRESMPDDRKDKYSFVSLSLKYGLSKQEIRTICKHWCAE